MDKKSQQFLRERVVCLLMPSVRSIIPFAEACYRFSPQIAIRDSEAIFIEIGGSRELFSEANLFLRLSVLAQRFDLLPKIGFGDDAAAALAAARFGRANLKSFPLEALYDYADPFQHNEVAFRKIDHMIENLRKLGLRNLEEFAAIPPKKFASRFGSEGVSLNLRVQQSFEGKLVLAWPRFRIPEKITEHLELHESGEFESCSGLDPLLFLSKNLLDRATARLRGRGLRASVLDIELGLESNHSLKSKTRQWKIELPVPQGTCAGILPILRERLRFDFERSPLEAQIESITISIAETTPGHRSQKDFFNESENHFEEWDALVGRLCQKLGKDRAFFALPMDRHLPEEAWSRTLSAIDLEEDFLDFSTPSRPSRVLLKPMPLQKQGDTFVLSEKKPVSWRVLRWDGPERIAGEWWSEQKFSRDYYRVLTETGEQLWIFENSSQTQSSGFYLHGYFD